MIRPPKFVTGECSQCHRDGWTRRVSRNLWTQEEYSFPIVVEGLPPGYEPMMAGAGSSIHEAVKEAVEYCQENLFKGVGFDFNGKLVLIDSFSEVNGVVDAWWKARYGESQAESFAKR